MNLKKLLLAVCVFGLAAGAVFAQDYDVRRRGRYLRP